MDVFEARRKAHTGTGKRVVPRGFGSFSRELPAQKTGAQSAPRPADHLPAYHKPKGAPAIGEAMLRDEIAAGDRSVRLPPAARSMPCRR